MNGPKHNKLGGMTERIVLWGTLLSLMVWIVAGMPGV